MALCDFVLID